MPGKDELVLAIAAYKEKRTVVPRMPAPEEASIEQQGRAARAIAAFQAGEPVYNIVVQGELVGQGTAGGTAELVMESVLPEELELIASRAVATLARGIGEQVMQAAAANEPPADVNARQG